MATLIDLTPALPSPDLEQLYVDSFPEAERRPVEAWRETLRPGGPARMVVARATATGRAVGFATVWRLPGALYVEHLAVLPELRGHGLGGEMVERLKGAAAYAGVPLLLEAEPAEASATAARRVAFYGRHGLTPVCCPAAADYSQPPYAPGLPSPRMTLLASAPIDDAVVDALRQRVYHQ